MTEAKRYRLTARAEMYGAIREPGFEFTLPLDKDGNEVLGPHRSVVASNHGAQITDHENAESGLVDVPLYEEVVEDAVDPDKERNAITERIMQLKAEIEACETKLAEIDGAPADGKPLLLEPPASTTPKPQYKSGESDPA